MSWLSRFNRWLSTPFRAARALFPFSHDGRQTLIYLMFSLSTGILTLIVWWAMDRLFNAQQWQAGKQLADKVAWGLLISISGYACFVSLRAISLGKDGLNVQGRDPPEDAPAAAQAVADSAQSKADDIKEATP
jgi:hypothetical protein